MQCDMSLIASLKHASFVHFQVRREEGSVDLFTRRRHRNDEANDAASQIPSVFRSCCKSLKGHFAFTSNTGETITVKVE